MYPEPEPADPRWRESRQPQDPNYGGQQGSGWDSTPPPGSGGTYRSSASPSSGGGTYSGGQPPYSGGAPQAPYQGDQGGYPPPAAPYSGGGQPPFGDNQAPYVTPYAQPPKPKSKLPLVLGIIGVVVLLCIGGVVVLAVIGNKAADDLAASTSTTGPSTPKNPAANPSSSEQSVEGNLERYKAGDCLTITGADNTVKPAKCTDAGAWKVLLRKDGTTSETACDSTDATQVLYQDGTGVKDDLVLCVKPVK